jgi:hypothetical protein
MIAIDAVVFIVAVLLLIVVLALVFGWARPGKTAPQAPSVKLVRAPRDAQGREELLLTVNERVILAASNEGLRLSDYADRVEQMEAVAARLAAALGTPVELARAGPRPGPLGRAGAGKPGDEVGIPINAIPPTSDEEVEQVEARRRATGSSGRDAA